MTKKEFVARIFTTPCERCPISSYCENATSITCTSTARQYYDLVKLQKGVFEWLEKRAEEVL